MDRIVTIIVLCFLSYGISAQIYGNTEYDDSENAWLTKGYITWWKIHTGESDSGIFTHYGSYVQESNEATEVHVALYSHDVANDKPDIILDQTEFTPTIGVHNQIPLSSSVDLEPDTYYWIAWKGDMNFHTGKLSTQNWDFPIHYLTHNFNLDFPDPAITTGMYTPHAHTVFVIANNSVLPIVLEHFEANQKLNDVELKWVTSEEINNKGWNIQRSNNGFSWNTIEWTDGSNNSTVSKTYSCIDRNPAKGMNYYRLEQLDYDGQKSYSEIVNVMFSAEEIAISIFPNPAQHFVQIENAASAKLFVYTQDGQLVQEMNIPQDGVVDTSNLPRGSYIFNVIEESREETFTIQLH